MVDSILSFEVDGGFLFFLSTSFSSLFPGFFSCRFLFLFLRLCRWGTVWSALQLDLCNPGLELSGTHVSELIVAYRVQIPEALVDEIKDFGVHFKSLLVILDQAQDRTAQKVAQKGPHSWIVLALHIASHLVQLQGLRQGVEEQFEASICLHSEFLSL